MTKTLPKHGSNGGYKAEIANGDEPCERCRNGRRVFQTQYTKAGKSKGLKYKSDQVIDHLYKGGRSGPPNRRDTTGPAIRTSPVADRTETHLSGPEPHREPPGETDRTGQSRDAGPSLSDRIASGLRNLAGKAENNPYVSNEEPPEYLDSLREIEPDPEPAGEEWSEVGPEEFVINAAGMAKIEENLGTYLSVIGMTVELIDPYCGPILGDNFDNIVKKWSKVISHYPKAATLFLDTKGGVLMTWIGAIQATWPILYAFYEHHLSRNIKVENGNVYRRNQNGQGPTVDATMPPMQEGFNYSAN